jgi:hypothetical protein
MVKHQWPNILTHSQLPRSTKSCFQWQVPWHSGSTWLRYRKCSARPNPCIVVAPAQIGTSDLFCVQFQLQHPFDYPLDPLEKGPELVCLFFFSVLCSFWISCPVHFPCYNIQGILELETAISTAFCNILQFEPLIFRGSCNILVLELFMSHSILHLGFI